MTSTIAPADIRVAQVYSVGKYTPDEVLAFAGAVPKMATDPVDKALRKHSAYEVDQFNPATPERKYSLAELPQGHVKQLVMRGDANAVLADAGLPKADKRKFTDAYEAARILGHRIMAVAVADVDHIGQKSGYFMAGFVALGIDRPGAHHGPGAPGNEWVRVELWTRSLRFQHWANVALIILMSLTGYYIMDPFFGGQPGVPGDTGYLMGYIRFAHFLAGFAWIAMGVWRLSLWLFSSQRQLRWRALWPLDSQRDIRGLWDTVLYYLFLKKDHAPYLAHNPLQQFAYTAIYALCIIQLLTGLALFGLYDQSSWIWVVLSYPVHWIGVPYTRLIHAALMFILWAFVVIHVYLAVRADTQETHGGVSAMINGGVWVKRDSQPLDAHRIGTRGLRL
ncbi:Ni/Fe-hydrogenase, b-type cytochrome subunit [Corynebacterium epidermidicanis]|uniref:Ni/Fe-hydrogenase, b-type cytochrome subunit n=1 Tax=Corynebacterium epidermidicanis TaxID=1050174 RepID=A0A0G3GPJ6_9CORY|nr:Ni/Fe-hydrogenase, b-type cytochrome subunit [Corynebacterium epidermidicanis]AKK02510.1 Ni/Fe-hydrogenase, b-type cytochrome subunit [Corynebacterium epidermidicanis]